MCIDISIFVFALSFAFGSVFADSPAHIMPLLEIVRTQHTSIQVLVDSLAFGKQIRKTSVIVGNCSGFVVNRVFFPYGEASHFLVDRGADLYHIDKVIQEFGMPMGVCVFSFFLVLFVRVLA